MSLPKIIKKLINIFIPLVCTLVLIIVFLISSESGSRLLVNSVISTLNDQGDISLSTTKINGSLLEGLSFSDLSIIVNGESVTTIAIDQLDLAWSLDEIWQHKVTVKQIIVQSASVIIEGTTLEPTPLDVSALIQPLFKHDYTISIEQASFNQLSISSNGASSTFAIPELDFHLTQESATIEKFLISYNDLQLTGENWQLLENHSISGQLWWNLRSTEPIFDGQFSFKGSLSTVELTHQLLNPLGITSIGEIELPSSQTSDLHFSIQHEIDNSALPSLYPSWLQTLNGVLQTNGSLDNINYLGNIQVVLTDQPTLALHLEGGWQETLLQGQWSIGNNDLFSLPKAVQISSPEAHGSFNIELNNGVQGKVTMDGFSALVNSIELEAQATMNFIDSKPGSTSVSISQGQNTVVIEGVLGEELDLNVNASLPTTSSLLPNLESRVSAEGVITGSIDAPSILASFNIENLYEKENELQIDALNFEVNLIDSSITLKADIENLQQSNTSIIDSGEVSLEGELDNHNYTAKLYSQYGSTSVSGTGQWQLEQWITHISSAETLSDFGNWNVEPNGIDLIINTEQQSIDLKTHCWFHESIQFCLSGEAAMNGMKLFNVAVNSLPLNWMEEENFSSPTKPSALQRLQENYQFYAPDNARLSGEIDFFATVSQTFNDNDWQLDLQFPAGQLQLGLTADDQISSSLSRDFTIEYPPIIVSKTEDLLSLEAQLTLTEKTDTDILINGSISTSLSLIDSENISGNINFSLPSLAWVETLQPNIKNLSGELIGSIQLSGTTIRPLVESQINISNGALEIPNYGLNISGLSFSLASDANNTINLNAEAHSGQGHIVVEATVETPLQPSRSAQVDVSGENFTILNLPNQALSISPSINLNATQQALLVNGNIEIPVFNLILDNDFSVSSGGIKESRDAYIVESESTQLLASTPTEREFSNIPFQGEVNVILGEDIHFQGNGLDIFLEGELTLEKKLNRSILSYGELRVTEGSYSLYGQTLTSQNGQLLFYGDPANPAIDLRVVREVETSTVGVHLNGTLNNIQGQLFSTPVLPESEILSMLISGKSFANINNNDSTSMLSAIASLGIERGQGLTDTISNKLGLDTVDIYTGNNFRETSVGIGKYLSPDLFVKYEVGLFDRESILNLNYFLSPHITLEVESGISQSIGLTYTIEK